MKLLFVIPALHPGGAERQMTLLCGGLARRGHSVSLAYFYAADPVFLDHLDPLVRAQCLAKPRGKAANVKLFVDLVRLIRRGRFDAVQSFLAHANLLTRSAAALTGTPALAGFRTGWRGSRAWLGVERALAPMTAAAIGNSRAIVEEAGRVYRIRRAYYLPNIFDGERFPYTDRTLGKEPRFVLVARYVPEKNHSFAVRLVKALRRRSVPATLDCFGPVGQRTYFDELRQAIEAEDMGAYVRLNGALTDVSERLADYHFMIFPSLAREGTPNVVLESLASGLPVILAERLAGDPYGGHCLAVPTDDVEAAADRVQKAIRSYDEGASRMARAAGRRYVEVQHPMEVVCRRYEAILREVVGE